VRAFLVENGWSTHASLKGLGSAALSHARIHIERRRGGQETRITVSGWPHQRASWTVYTADQVPLHTYGHAALCNRLGRSGVRGGGKGRVLSAIGWHSFKPYVAVGAALLHVEEKRPLRVTSLVLMEHLASEDAQDVRTALLGCAAGVATALHAKGVGNGCLDWEVPQPRAGQLRNLHPQFEMAPRKDWPRGDRALLRRCAGDA
jgi:hypothetical protein